MKPVGKTNFLLLCSLVFHVGDFLFLIRWFKKTCTGGICRRSNVNIHFQKANYTTNPGDSVRNALIRQLDAFSTYAFSVRERTTAGWGPYSNSVFNKTLEGSK